MLGETFQEQSYHSSHSYNAILVFKRSHQTLKPFIGFIDFYRLYIVQSQIKSAAMYSLPCIFITIWLTQLIKQSSHSVR